MSVSPPAVAEDSTLHVTAIEEAEWHTIVKVTRAWKTLAEDKFNQWNALLKGSPEFIPMTPQESSERLAASHRLVTIMHNCLTLEKEEDDDPWDKIYACFDGARKIQALAFVQNERHFVSFLATNPDNISHYVNERTPKVRGAATEILKHLAKISLIEHKPLRLEAMPDTEGSEENGPATEGNRYFYSSLGFKRITGAKAREREIETDGLIPMVLKRDSKLMKMALASLQLEDSRRDVA